MTDVLSRPAPSPDAVVRYAAHPDGLLDLHLPTEQAARGTVVLIHGGFWRAEHDRVHTRPLADALRREGFVVATPEYRRTGATAGQAGGWPETPHDVRSAVAQLPGLLDRVAVRSVGPTLVVGHSAGGHLALWLASERLPIHRVVALAPVGDLHDAYARDLDGGAVLALLGGSPTELPRRYAEADPAVRLASAPGPEVVILHGTHDLQVPVGNSDWAVGRDHIVLRHLAGADHFAMIDPTSRVWDELLQTLGDGSDPPTR